MIKIPCDRLVLEGVLFVNVLYFLVVVVLPRFNTSSSPFVPPLALKLCDQFTRFKYFPKPAASRSHLRLINNGNDMLVVAFFSLSLSLRSGYTKLGYIYGNQTPCKRINIPIKT